MRITASPICSTRPHAPWYGWLRVTLWLTLLLTQVGCQAGHAAPSYTGPTHTYPAMPMPSATAVPDDALAIAHLKLAQQHMAQHQYRLAKQALDTVNPTAQPAERYPYTLLLSRWYMAQHEPWKAVKALQQLTPPDPSQAEEKPYALPYGLALADAYAANHQNLSAIRTRMALDAQLRKRDAASNQQAIWQSAQRMSLTQLNSALAERPTPQLAGWLSLARIERLTQQHQPDWLSQLHAWRLTYPKHPAQQMLRTELLKQAYAGRQPPVTRHIALLLPRSGSLAQVGNAITQGFLTAYYQHPNVKLTMMDSAQGDILTLYQKAVAQGADHIVGPLSKDHIQRLAEQQAFQVPTLVLNNISQPIQPQKTQVIQFGLSPIDEAQQMANHAWQRGLRRVLVIAPDNDWGRSLALAFQSHWRMLGGQTVETVLFDSTAADQRIGAQIQNSLGVNQSTQRINRIHQTMHETILSRPTIRPDIDWVVLLTTAPQSRRLYPLLKFYYLGNVPTYALAQSNPGTALSPNYFRDLHGIYLPTTAWMSNPDQLQPPLKGWRQTILKTWPQSFARHARFYALGIDSEQLTRQWAAFTLYKGDAVQGASGTLSLTPFWHVHRNLNWGQIRNTRRGQPIQWLRS